MPTILSSPTTSTGQIIGQLERLGGRVKVDYRFTYVGAPPCEALEVSDELYQRWQASLGTQPADDAADPAAPEGDDAAELATGLAKGINTVAEHSGRDYTATQGRSSAAEHAARSYPETRQFNSVAPRTAHNQDDPPALTVTKTGTALQASVLASNGGHIVVIRWGDGTASDENPGDGTTASLHTYPAAGTYVISAAAKVDPGIPATETVVFTALAEDAASDDDAADLAGDAAGGGQPETPEDDGGAAGQASGPDPTGSAGSDDESPASDPDRAEPATPAGAASTATKSSRTTSTRKGGK